MFAACNAPWPQGLRAAAQPPAQALLSGSLMLPGVTPPASWAAPAERVVVAGVEAHRLLVQPRRRLAAELLRSYVLGWRSEVLAAGFDLQHARDGWLRVSIWSMSLVLFTFQVRVLPMRCRRRRRRLALLRVWQARVAGGVYAWRRRSARVGGMLNGAAARLLAARRPGAAPLKGQQRVACRVQRPLCP